jgi:hypothetical protein
VKATAGTNTPAEKAGFIADVNALLRLVLGCRSQAISRIAFGRYLV